MYYSKSLQGQDTAQPAQTDDSLRVSGKYLMMLVLI